MTETVAPCGRRLLGGHLQLVANLCKHAGGNGSRANPDVPVPNLLAPKAPRIRSNGVL